MSIRIREINGHTVALCAAETDPMPGDIYLDDAAHYALAAKFCQDWQGRAVNWQYPEQWAAMATQKLRDAAEEMWLLLGVAMGGVAGAALLVWALQDVVPR